MERKVSKVSQLLLRKKQQQHTVLFWHVGEKIQTRSKLVSYLNVQDESVNSGENVFFTFLPFKRMAEKSVLFCGV